MVHPKSTWSNLGKRTLFLLQRWWNLPFQPSHMYRPPQSILGPAAGLLAGLLLGGCLSPPPPGLRDVSLSKVNSTKVTRWNVRFEKRDGRLYLCGHVFRHYPAANDDTSRTHLTISLFNTRVEPLLRLPAEFMPRQIPRGARSPGYSIFSVPLDVLPEQTNSIQIRLDDEPALDTRIKG